jgi:hypothetical protein
MKRNETRKQPGKKRSRHNNKKRKREDVNNNLQLETTLDHFSSQFPLIKHINQLIQTEQKEQMMLTSMLQSLIHLPIDLITSVLVPYQSPETPPFFSPHCGLFQKSSFLIQWVSWYLGQSPLFITLREFLLCVRKHFATPEGRRHTIWNTIQMVDFDDEDEMVDGDCISVEGECWIDVHQGAWLISHKDQTLCVHAGNIRTNQDDILARASTLSELVSSLIQQPSFSNQALILETKSFVKQLPQNVKTMQSIATKLLERLESKETFWDQDTVVHIHALQRGCFHITAQIESLSGTLGVNKPELLDIFDALEDAADEDVQNVQNEQLN